MSPVDLLLSRLDSPRPNGRDRWRAACPCCGERNRSTLSVGVGDSGCVLVKCFKNGCGPDEIARAVGLDLEDFFFPPRDSSGRAAAPRRMLTAAQALELLGAEATLDLGCRFRHRSRKADHRRSNQPRCRSRRTNRRTTPGDKSMSAAIQKIDERIAANGGPRLAPDTLRVLRLDELLRHPFPKREPLLGDWLLTSGLAMVHSWRGTGKTHFSLGVGYAVASGGTFLRWTAPKPRRVFYIDGEMPGSALAERLATIVAHAEGEEPAENFAVLTPDVRARACRNWRPLAGSYRSISP